MLLIQFHSGQYALQLHVPHEVRNSGIVPVTQPKLRVRLTEKISMRPFCEAFQVCFSKKYPQYSNSAARVEADSRFRVMNDVKAFDPMAQGGPLFLKLLLDRLTINTKSALQSLPKPD